ncbi:MAG: hypothetical protein V4616_08620, partial [Bacteroidota bacterium]
MKQILPGSGMKYLCSLILIALTSRVLAQDPCIFPGTKAEVADFQRVLSSGLGKDAKIHELFDLGQEYPDNSRLLFEIGRLQFLIQENEEIPDYTLARKNFEGAQRFCQDISPLIDYYLGIIYYSQKEYPRCLKSFNRFLLQPENPEDKFHEAKLNDVRSSIPVIEKEMRESNRSFSDDELIRPEMLMKVSTAKSEYLPMLSPDNSMLLFTRKTSKQNRGEDFARELELFSLANKIGEPLYFDEGKAVPDPFNMGGNYGGASLSPSNKVMYITVCIPLESGYKNCDIFQTRYEMYRPDPAEDRMAFHWTPLQNLGNAINAPDTWEAQPSISPDGKILYFTRFGKTTRETDLYYSEMDSAGNWQTAVAFPEPINTEKQDKAPFMHQDGKTLYYATTGRGGEGGFDIFMTTKSDTGNTWSRPKNVGKPVNSFGDEHGMLVTTNGKYAVFASNGGKSVGDQYDLFYVELPEKSRPEEIFLVKGKIDFANSETKLQLKNSAGEFLRDVALDKSDGTYVTILKRREVIDPLILSVEQDGVAYEARIIDSTRVVNGVIDNETMEASTISANTAYV